MLGFGVSGIRVQGLRVDHSAVVGDRSLWFSGLGFNSVASFCPNSLLGYSELDVERLPVVRDGAGMLPRFLQTLLRGPGDLVSRVIRTPNGVPPSITLLITDLISPLGLQATLKPSP